MDNTLYLSDNLNVLREGIPKASVDLVYLDPPFKSNRNYNITCSGKAAKAEAQAFTDNWSWDDITNESYNDLLKTAPRKVSQCIRALHQILGKCDMLAYITMMTPRLVELHRVLKPSGSIYLHCDHNASHYLKLVMDVIFGRGNFQNEIIWGYRTGGATKKRWSKKHDVILFYSRSAKFNFNCEKDRIYYEKPFFTNQQDENGKYYADVLPVDWWIIPAVINVSSERIGYPTQKPVALLERIIKASSNNGDVILDPFCGCGTTLVTAESMHRRWIGIDIETKAIEFTIKRLYETFGKKVKFNSFGKNNSSQSTLGLKTAFPVSSN